MNAEGSENRPGVSEAVADDAREHSQQPKAKKGFLDRRPWSWFVLLASLAAGTYTAWVGRNTRTDPPGDAEPAVTHPWRERRHVPAPVRIFADWARPLPLDPPWSFPQSVDRLWSQLKTDDDALADELLSDAEQLFAEADANVKSAEQRASTLQGAVAIAATVAIAAGGVLLDPTKLHGHGWRTAFAIGFAVLVLLLALAGWRATQASARLGWFTTASDKDILVRAGLRTAAMAKTHRAAYLLHGYGRNAEMALLKVIYLRKAANWFRGAVVVLVVLMAMECVYVTDASGRRATPTTSPPPSPTSTAPSRLSPTFPGLGP